MKMALTLENFWTCIQENELDSNKDQTALARICLSLKPHCYQQWRSKEGAAGAGRTRSTLRTMVQTKKIAGTKKYFSGIHPLALAQLYVLIRGQVDAIE